MTTDAFFTALLPYPMELPRTHLRDPFDLRRFVEAQSGVYSQACSELRRGRKSGHWMWFIFPQVQGLGKSYFSTKYAIGSRAEAKAYLNHAVLGPRLLECTEIVKALQQPSAIEIFGYEDARKFRSSMTLFAVSHSGQSAFSDALQMYFDGKPDPLTLARLETA